MSLLYTSRFEVALGALARYDEWFVRHATDLLGVGFLKVHGYRSSVAPRALSNVYELPDLAVFGDAYAAAREADDLGRAVRPFLTPAELGVFAPLSAGGAVLGAAGLGVLDLDAGRDATAVGEWLAGRLPDSATVFGSTTAPVAPAVDGRLRVVVASPDPDEAYRVTDQLAATVGEQWPDVVLTTDVLTHRISYPLTANP